MRWECATKATTTRPLGMSHRGSQYTCSKKKRPWWNDIFLMISGTTPLCESWRFSLRCTTPHAHCHTMSNPTIRYDCFASCWMYELGEHACMVQCTTTTLRMLCVLRALCLSCSLPLRDNAPDEESVGPKRGWQLTRQRKITRHPGNKDRVAQKDPTSCTWTFMSKI